MDRKSTHGRPRHPAVRHVAVALDYEPGARRAPRIVASGRGAIAERILELARAHGITVREDADLAEMLSAMSVGDQIPVAAFAVVAEILFYILKANGRLPAAERGHDCRPTHRRSLASSLGTSARAPHRRRRRRSISTVSTPRSTTR